jgi:proteasome lid subunit RPN8/RPN11
MTTNIIMSPGLADAISKHFTSPSFSDPRQERCGVLLGGVRDDGKGFCLHRFEEVVNSSDTPCDRYIMTVEDVTSVGMFSGFKITDVIGSIHTHPKGSGPDPSGTDIEDQPRNTLGCVVHVTSGRLTFYTCEGVVSTITKGKAHA